MINLVEKLMEERCLWVDKNAARTILQGRSSRYWSGSAFGKKTGGKKIIHTVISFEALGKKKTALHLCYYVNRKPEYDPDRHEWLWEEIEARLHPPKP